MVAVSSSDGRAHDQSAISRISLGRMRMTEPDPPRPRPGKGPRSDAAESPLDRLAPPGRQTFRSAGSGLWPGAAGSPAAPARSRAARAAPDSQLLPQRQHLRLDGARRQDELERPE